VIFFYTGFLLDTTLTIFLNVALILTALHARRNKIPSLWGLTGILIGLIILLKPNIVLFLPFFVIWFFYTYKEKIKRKKIADFACMTIMAVLILMPFSIRNYIIEKSFSPFSVHGGVNFYMGNNPKATGAYMGLYDIPDSAVSQVKASIDRAEEETGKDLTPREASSYWFRKGFRYIRNNKLEYLSLLSRKTLLFWNSEEVYINLNFYFCKRFIPILSMPLFSFGIIAPFAMLGFLIAVKKRSRGLYLIAAFILTYMTTVVLYIISSRYRMPSVPFIIIFSSYGLYAFTEIVRKKKVKEASIFILMVLVSFVFINREAPDVKSRTTFSASYYNLGNTYFKNGILNNAIEEYQKAIKLRPEYLSARNNLGVSYLFKGMTDEAIKEYKKLVEIDPDYLEAHTSYAPTHFNLRFSYFTKGMTDAAISEYKKAISLNPKHADAHFYLGNAYYKKRMLDEAIRETLESIKIEPKHAEAHNNLAVYYYQKKDLYRSGYHCKKALNNGFKVNPELLRALSSAGGKLKETIGK